MRFSTTRDVKGGLMIAVIDLRSHVLQYNLNLGLILEMWANAQRDGRPAEHRWRPRFNAAKNG